MPGNRPSFEEFEEILARIIARMAEAGHPVVSVSKRRTAAEQQELYAKGRTKPGQIVTELDGITKQSHHQTGTAADLVFVGKDGKPTFDGPWDLLGEVAEAEGLEWGGRWKSLVDKPHVQYQRKEPVVAARARTGAARSWEPVAPSKGTTGSLARIMSVMSFLRGAPQGQLRATPTTPPVVAAVTTDAPRRSSGASRSWEPSLPEIPVSQAGVPSSPLSLQLLDQLRATHEPSPTIESTSELERLFGQPDRSGALVGGSELERLLGPRGAPVAAPAPVEAPPGAPESPIRYKGMFGSVVSPQVRGKVASAIAGHETPTPLDAPVGLSDIVKAVKEEGLLKSAFGLTGIPAVWELGKTAVETGPDIARGLVSHPVETLRGGASGVAEGAMEAASPFNALMLLLGGRKLLKRRKAPAVEAPAPKGPQPRVAGKQPPIEQSLTEILEELRRPEGPSQAGLPRTDLQPVVTADAAETLARQRLQRGATPAIERRVQDVGVPWGIVDRRKFGPKVEAGARDVQAKIPGGEAGVPELTARINSKVDQRLGVVRAKTNTFDKEIAAGRPEIATARIAQSVQELAKEFKQHVTAQEFSGILAGREKLTSQVGGRPLPRGMRDQVDRLGLEYRRTREALKQARAQKADPREIQRLAQAEKELGSRLYQTSASARKYAKLGDESGAIDPRLLATAGAGAAGAAVGASEGEDTQEKLLYGGVGAVIGAGVVAY